MATQDFAAHVEAAIINGPHARMLFSASCLGQGHGVGKIMSIEEQEIAGLKTCPAVVASGLRAAQLASGGADVAKTAIHSVMRALGSMRQGADQTSLAVELALRA